MKRLSWQFAAMAAGMVATLVGVGALAESQGAPAAVQPRPSMLYPIMPGQPGQYQIVDVSQIQQNQLVFAEKMEQQDWDAYQAATASADKTYKEMYGNCPSGTTEWKSCTGLMKLRQIHILTDVSKSTYIDAAEFTQAVLDFKKSRDLFQTQLTALSMMKDVWQNIGAQTLQDSKAQQAVLVYQKGAVNLKAFTDVYADGISKMVNEAMALTYRVGNNAQIIETKPNMGLEEIATENGPEVARQQLQYFQDKGALTPRDRQDLSAMTVGVAGQMSSYTAANGTHLYWNNGQQTQDGKDWVASLQLKARIIQYAKAVYCTPMGVPAMDVPALKAWDLGYLKRGSPIRIIAKSETDEQAIRSTLRNFDEAFLSMQSQGGELNDAGGVIGFLNKINSTLTWQNEVGAWLNVMKITRFMYQDELDIMADPVDGCEKVRQRYYALYGSIKNDKAFLTKADMYLSGRSGSTDQTMVDFKIAGRVILSNLKYLRDGQDYVRNHPEASLIESSIDNDPTLQ